MALKDLKSDLSKFRKPQPKPLSDKPRVEPSTFNTTPLSDKVQGKKAPTPNPTPEKLGVTPTEVKQGDKFKGETTPKPMSLEERFLGQTETQEIKQGDKFKGETTPTEATQGDKFKGETTPNNFTFTQQFLGETEPREFTFSQQFLGETTPNTFDISSKFLGETEQIKSDLSSKFLGETETTLINQGDKFKGETEVARLNQGDKFKGETEVARLNQGDKEKGETTPNDFKFNPNFDSQAKDPKFVNFITDDNAKGFSPYQQPKNNSTFVGVDPSQTEFDGANSLYGSIKDTPYDVRLDNDSGLGSFYSNSILRDTYNKFNLKKDSYKHSLSTIQQPFILSGIQKKNGEPTTLGLGSTSFIRGGALTSTARAALDVLRISEFLLTPRGIIWSLKQVGMQSSQKHQTTWTPVNLLATIGAQHLGERPERAGVKLINEITSYLKIGNPIQLQIPSDSLKSLWGDARKTQVGGNWKSQPGGFDSLYGLGITDTKRNYNTFIIDGKTDIVTGNKNTGQSNYKQLFNPLDILNDKEFKDTYNSTIPTTDEEKLKFGRTLRDDKLADDIDEKNKLKPKLLKSDGIDADRPDIKDYQAISYGKVKEVAEGRTAAGTKVPRDFRDDLGSRSQERAKSQNFKDENIEKKFKFGTPGGIVPDNIQQKIADFSKKNDLKGFYDEVNAKLIGDADDADDIVPLIFQLGSDGSRLQFRGTISGLSENFSPNYTEVKYSGRAEPVYIYDSFKRDITFNFKVYPTSRVEMQPLYTKLERLSTYTMPRYESSGGYSAPGNSASDSELLLTIGKLYNKTPMILTSLSYSYSDDTAWDVDFGLPMGIDIQVGCTVLGNNIHEYDSEKVFAFDGSFRV